MQEEGEARVRPRVIVSALPDREFPAHVKEFATAADAVTRTFRATFSFSPPDDLNVRPGMTARITFDMKAMEDTGSVISIPARAAFTGAGGAARVWLLDTSSMTTSSVPVSLGEMNGENVVLLSGLSDGDLVVVSGVSQLREGMTVRRLED